METLSSSFRTVQVDFLDFISIVKACFLFHLQYSKSRVFIGRVIDRHEFPSLSVVAHLIIVLTFVVGEIQVD